MAIRKHAFITKLCLALTPLFISSIVIAQGSDDPVVNDYSNYGAAEYSDSSSEANTSAGTASTASSEPTVNDYSNYGAAEYGSSDSGASQGDSSEQAGSENTLANSAQAGGAPYEVDCSSGACKANEAVVLGYQKFVGHCSQCHGETAEGSTFAPSLVQQLKGMDKETFVNIVSNGQTSMNPGTGTYSVMPPWGNNKSVMDSIDSIWAFLKARSDGALKAGRPEQM
jgi:mono/diheme cytochrome c family protein